MTVPPGTLRLHWVLDGRQQDADYTCERVILGRLPTCDLVLRSDSVSRQHAEFRRTGDAWFVHDLGAKNHVYVNDQMVARRELRDGDRVRLGTIEFLCQLASTATTGSAVVFEDTDYPGDLAEFRQMDDFQSLLAESLVAHVQPPAPAGATQPGGSSADTESKFQGGAWIIKLFNDAIQSLLSSQNLDSMLEQVLELAFRQIPAERGIVCLYDERTKTRTPKASRCVTNDEAAEIRISETIARAALEKRRSVLFRDRDPAERNTFVEALSIINLEIHSAMCAPLLRGDSVGGFIYVDTRSERRPFRTEDLDVLSTLALLSAVAVEQTRLRDIRRRLSRYSSPNVVEKLVESAEVEEDMLAQEAEITVMFADLTGFTPMAEQLPPTEVTRILNALFEHLTQSVFEFEGTLDKFIGDEVMAFWGAPIPQPDHAARAVRAALRMQETLERLAQTQGDELPRLRMSIGINSGPAVVGDIGSRDRRDYTVIGDSVNTAKRIETRAESTQILIGPQTYEEVKGLFECRPLAPIELKGKAKPLQTYLVVGAKTSAETR